MDYISHLYPGYLLSQRPEFDLKYPDVVVSHIDFNYIQNTTKHWSIQSDGRDKQHFVHTASGRFTDKKSLEDLNGWYVKTSYDSYQIYIFNYFDFLESL